MKKGQLILIGLLIISILGNLYFLFRKNPYEEVTKVIETIKVDTIRDSIPVPIETYKLRTKHDTLLFDKVVLVEHNDTVKVVVDVPIEQKVYQRDSVYKAWVSGYDVNLDSIRIYQMTKEILEVRTVKDNRKWSLGPAVFGGYDINNKQLGYGVGISIQYNLLKW